MVVSHRDVIAARHEHHPDRPAERAGHLRRDIPFRPRPRCRASSQFAEKARRYGLEPHRRHLGERSEEHTSELQSLMRISYAVFCLKKKKNKSTTYVTHTKLH